MEVYLPPDESELFKYVCLDQKVLFQIMKGVQAFISEQPLPLQLPPCHFVLKALSPSRSFPAPVPLPGVSSLILLTGSEGNEPLHHRPGASLWNWWKYFLLLALLSVLLPTPACHFSRELEVVLGFLPLEYPVKLEWLGCSLSSCASGLLNFCTTSFFRTGVSLSKEFKQWIKREI